MIVEILQYLSGIPDWLAVIFLAALPITELRASLPLALFYFDLSPVQAVVFSLIGNTIPLFLIFIFFPPWVNWLSKNSPRLHEIVFRRLQLLEKRHQKNYQRWGAIFLCLFVAVPLPGSGVWTGSLLAVIFNMRPRLSIPAILIGMLCSSGIVLALSLGAGSSSL